MNDYSNYVDPGENAVDTTPSSQNNFLNYLGNSLRQLQQSQGQAQPQGQAQSGLMFPWRTAGKSAGGQQQGGGGLMKGLGGGLCG